MSSSACIDLIFTDQPNLVVNSGFHPSLYKNCHNQITFCKLNLKIEYLPPPYERLVWDYKKVDTSSIRKVLKQANWEFLFKKKNVQEPAILNKIFECLYYVPNKMLLLMTKIHHE